ncbi:non-hydrolyzing UDP-N-acetylglucosamine 2-epimerase [Patescibacteria group bacterium]
MKHIVSIIGARPQFVKAAPLSHEIRKQFKETLIHTGQHYDKGMSDIFFSQLEIPKPDYNLEIGSGSHGVQTGKMLEKLDPLIQKLAPDIVTVYGDTNSTLAGALTAAKLNIPLAHVESGLRSFNNIMPEETNRIVADRLSNILFCPTELAVENLKKEGVTQGVHLVGDIMKDVLLQSIDIAKEKSLILKKYSLTPQEYFLCTIHRAENTNNPERLNNFFEALFSLDKTVVLPLHPRTKKLMPKELARQVKKYPHILIIDPISYLDMVQLERNAKTILTDSGGMQKEAYILKVPCITLRTETEWKETLVGNWNQVGGVKPDSIFKALNTSPDTHQYQELYGDGKAAEKITRILHEHSAT